MVGSRVRAPASCVVAFACCFGAFALLAAACSEIDDSDLLDATPPTLPPAGSAPDRPTPRATTVDCPFETDMITRGGVR